MKTNKQHGLIKLIILIVIAIAVLSWYGIDIKEFFMSEQMQKNLGYIWNFIKEIWTNYLAGPAHKLWTIWLEYFWGPFMNMLGRGDHTNVLNP